MLEDHEHEDGGHTHTASSTTEPHKHNTYWRRDRYAAGPGDWGLGYTNNDDTAFPNHMDETTVNVTTTCSLASQTSNLGSVDTENSNAGHETRPANMKILYIMRVFQSKNTNMIKGMISGHFTCPLIMQLKWKFSES